MKKVKRQEKSRKEKKRKEGREEDIGGKKEKKYDKIKENKKRI